MPVGLGPLAKVAGRRPVCVVDENVGRRASRESRLPSFIRGDIGNHIPDPGSRSLRDLVSRLGQRAFRARRNGHVDTFARQLMGAGAAHSLTAAENQRMAASNSQIHSVSYSKGAAQAMT
ncbi:hypothetical protein FQZ97_623980 [compost metagenome]